MTSQTKTVQNRPRRISDLPHGRHMPGNGFREAGIALLWALSISTLILGTGGWRIYSSWREREDQRQLAIEQAQAYERLIASAPGPMLTLDAAIHGRELFASACAACHGTSGKGATGLGKNLVESDFVALQDDEMLRQFIITGRPTGKPIPMPPLAGRDDLTNDDLHHIVVYLRGLQDPRRMPELPEMVVDKTPTASQLDSALAAAGGDPELAEWIASGDRIYHSSCMACHGKSGTGVAGNGKALVRNDFIKSIDDDALLAFITQGRSPSDPKNTTGIQMPPKGGNPAMSQDDILDVIAYLRTLQGDAHGSANPK